MNNFSGSIHTKKKVQKQIKRDYALFSSHRAVPPVIAIILLLVGVGATGLVSWQLWSLGSMFLQVFSLVVWYIIALLGVILWRSLYHRRIELYPNKIVVYDIFSKSEVVLTNILGYYYTNPNMVFLKHRSSKGATKLHLEVEGRQHLEQWLREGFVNIENLSV